jgi:hypothetical protein
MAKGYLKLHEWEGKKLISDINLQYVELCPSAPEKAPEKERLTTWEPSLKNDDAK